MDIFIIVVLLLLSAVFSASETAFSAAKDTRLRAIAQDGGKRAKLAIKISESFDKALTAILIGNNIVNLAAASVATLMVTNRFGAQYVAVGTAVITVLVIIFGEILPKNLAKEYPETFCLFIAYPLWWMITVFTPLVWLLIKLKNLVVKLVGGENDQPSMTEEELKLMIDEIEDEGVLDESESDLVKNALEFSDISVSEILIPRVNIAAVEMGDDVETIKEVFITSHFSRLPVYEKTIDSIVGIIHEKNFFDMYLHGRRDINEIIQKPLYIFGLTSISDIMKELQRSKSHMAVVVDQYGGTQGIITMEDIIEEIVGNIMDEYDEEEKQIERTSEDSYEVDGLTLLDDLEDLLDITFDTEDYETVNGFMIAQLHRLPADDESGEVDYGGYHFKVLEAKNMVIRKVRITKLEGEEDKSNDDNTQTDE